MLKTILNKWLLVDPVALVFEILSDGAIIKQIEQWNKEQLLDGKNSLDVKLSDIGGNYSNFTLSLHPEKIRDKVNLYDTGEFHDSITVKVNKELLFSSNPQKIDDNGNVTNLYDRWGSDIIGLNEENFNTLIYNLKDVLIREILQEVQGN